jgi:hypothetical protein
MFHAQGEFNRQVFGGAVITALVHARHGPEALTATLAALVPGVAEGLVGDAVVLAAEAGWAAPIAEAAGADVVLLASGQDPWRAGAGRARRPWLLCLEDGDVPAEGWIGALSRHLARPDPPPARLRRSGAPGLLRDLAAALAGAAPAPGALVRRDALPGRHRPALLAARLVRA